MVLFKTQTDIHQLHPYFRMCRHFTGSANSMAALQRVRAQGYQFPKVSLNSGVYCIPLLLK